MINSEAKERADKRSEFRKLSNVARPERFELQAQLPNQ